MSHPLAFTVTATGLQEVLRSVSANQADANMRLLLLENRQRDSERQARETEKRLQQQLQQCEARLTELVTTLSATISSSQPQSHSETRLTDLITTLTTKIEEAALTHNRQPPSDEPSTDLILGVLDRLEIIERLFRHCLHGNGDYLAPDPHREQAKAYSDPSQNILPKSMPRGTAISSDTILVGSPFTHHAFTDTEDTTLPVTSVYTGPRMDEAAEPVRTMPSLMFSCQQLSPERLRSALASRQEDHDMDCHIDDNADENVDPISDDQSEVDMVPARQPSQATTVPSANRHEEVPFRHQGEEDTHLSRPHDDGFDNIQIASHRARPSPDSARDGVTRNEQSRTNDDLIKNFKVRAHADQLDGRGAKRQRDVEDQDDTFQLEDLQPPAQFQTQTQGIPLQRELPRNQSRSQPPEGQRRSNRQPALREPMDGMVGTPDFCKPSVWKKLNLK
ncbi:hypothetical protein BDV97DRAFT_425139 [Delphinella strobiligena]|nr:hypothetical protein BDV97DRAFT_425139 [Delphinella strobiligena]